MAALVSAAEIPPGGEGEIKATVNTRGRRGNLRKSISVETSDPENQRAKLVLKGKVIVEAELDPHYFNFGRMDQGEKATKSGTLVARDPGKVRITKVEWIGDTPDARAKIINVKGTNGAKATQGVEVTFSSKEVGLIRRRLKVYTSSDKVPHFEVMVRAQVLGNWELSPRSVSFSEPREDAQEQELRRVIRLKNRKSTPHRVIKVVDSAGAVETKIKRTDSGYEIELRLKEVPVKRRGVIEITTTDPAEKIFKVRYYVRKLRPGRRRPPRPVHRPVAPRPPIQRIDRTSD